MRNSLAAAALLFGLSSFGAAFASDKPVYLADLANQHPEINTSFATLMAPAIKQADWVKNFGTASPAEYIQLDGKQYAVFTGCRPHNCPSESYAALYNPTIKQFVAGAYIQNTTTNDQLSESKIIWLNGSNTDLTNALGSYLFP